MKKIGFKKLLTIVFTVAMIVGGGWVAYWYYIHAQLQGRFFFDWAQTANTSHVTLTVENTTFRIPKNYLLNRSSRKGGKVGGFIMAVLLPELDPYSEQNAVEFNKLGWNRKMNILVQARDGSPLTDGQFNNAISNSYDSASGELATPLSFESYTGRIIKDHLFARKQNGVVDLFLICNTHDLVPSPSCRVHFDFNDEISVDATFSRDHLPLISKIETNIRRLLERLQISQTM